MRRSNFPLTLASVVTLCALLSGVNSVAQTNGGLVDKGARRGIAPAVGEIKNTMIGGAGCAYQRTGGRRARGVIFFAEFEDDAWVNVDGRDLRLKPARGQAGVYEGGGLKVTVDMREVGGAEEGTSYRGRLIFERGGAKTVVRAEGVCGA